MKVNENALLFIMMKEHFYPKAYEKKAEARHHYILAEVAIFKVKEALLVPRPRQNKCKSNK